MRPTMMVVTALLCLLGPANARNVEAAELTWGNASWIWDDSVEAPPAGSVYFRREFELAAAPKAAAIMITVDNRYVLHVNGTKVGADVTWNKAEKYDVAKFLVVGKNAIAIEAVNDGGAAGLIAVLQFDGGGKMITTDGSWRCSTRNKGEWTKAGYDDKGWEKAVVQGGADMGPWSIAAGSTAGGGKPDKGAVAEQVKGYRPADEQAERFVVPEGFKVELVAAEPLVINPVAIIQDEKGRLYVSESHTYRYGKAGSPVPKATNPIIRLDPGADGKLTRVLVAEGFDDPVMGMAIRDRQLWASANDFLFRFDLSEAGLATNKTVILKEKNKAWNPFGNFVLEWGPEGLLYMSVGDHKIELVNSKGEKIVGRGNSGIVMRMNGDGTNMERLTHGFRVPYSFEYDPFGQLWLLSNGEGNPNRFARIIEGVDYHCFTRGVDNEWLAGRNPLAPPAAELPAGAHTQLVRYFSSVFPREYWGSLLLDNWGQHGYSGGNRTIFRYVPDERGHIQAKERFVECRDPHFRCSHILVSQEGDLLLSDWYGRDDESDKTGRIWRVTYKGKQPKQEQQPTPRELSDDAHAVAALSSPNHAVRENTAAQLAKRGNSGKDGALIGKIAAHASAAKEPIGAAMAMWTLVRIGSTDSLGAIAAGGAHEDYRVRRLALMLLRRYGHEAAASLGAKLLDDKDAAVRIQAAMNLGDASRTRTALIAALASGAAADPHLRYEAAFHLASIVDAASLQSMLTSAEPDLRLAGLLTIDIACWESTPARPAALAAIASLLEKPGEFDMDTVLLLAKVNPDATLASGLTKLAMREDLPPATSAKAMLLLRAMPGKPAIDLTGNAGRRFVTAVRSGQVKLSTSADVVLYINLLEGEGPTPDTINQLAGRLNDGSPEVRKAVIDLAKRFGAKADALSPALWRKALDTKAKTNDRLPLIGALASVENKPDAEQWKKLLADPNSEVVRDTVRSWRGFAGDKAMTETLNAAAMDLLKRDANIVSDLSAVMIGLGAPVGSGPGITPAVPVKPSDYASRTSAALAFKPAAGSSPAAMGRRVFERVGCVKCHTAVNADVLRAPSLNGIGKAQTLQYLIESILEPSKILKTGFDVERIEMKDGEIYVGLVKDDGDMLRVISADAELRIGKADVTTRTVQKLSLMPTNLTDMLSQDEFNDLVAYLRSLQ